MGPLVLGIRAKMSKTEREGERERERECEEIQGGKRD